MTKKEALEVLNNQIDSTMGMGAILFFKNGEKYVGFDLDNESIVIHAAEVALQPNKALEGII